MRIGFDAKRAFFNKSGLGSYSRNLIQGLTDKHPENEYYLYTPGLNEELFAPIHSSIKIVTPVRPFHRIFSSYWRTFHLSKQLPKDGIEIYHGLSHELPYNFPKKEVKSVVTIHRLFGYETVA